MKGIQSVRVSNRDASFKFELHRNITIVRGDSGTGKTTLFEMIADYTRLGNASGVNISCGKKCVALVDIDWKNQLKNTKDSIVFIDEGFQELKTSAFSSAARSTDNYYVIFTRDSLHNLPYSVEEIYEIKTSGKYHTFRKMFRSRKNHMYGRTERFSYNYCLTEDSKSGYQFFKKVFSEAQVSVDTARSNSSIFNWLNQHKDRTTFIIADGAAFGSEIDRILKLQESGSVQFRIVLPESFEWLILKSGLIKAATLTDILNNPSDHVECGEYFSWERFFTAYLVNNTVNTPFEYSKSEINPIYLIKANSDKITSEIISDNQTI